MTDFDDDEKIVKLTEDFGLAGQARLLKIYRLIARQMDESDRCSVVYRAGFWTRQLGFRSATDCRSFVDRLATDQLLIADLSGNEWLVKCPKLLEIRARKKPIGNETRTLEVEVEVEVEKESKPEAFSLQADPPKKGGNGALRNKAKQQRPRPRSPQVCLGDDFRWSGISEDQLQRWRDTYPALSIDHELKAAAAWIEANPKNRKSNWTSYIVRWLKRGQDRAPRIGGQQPGFSAPPTKSRFE